LVTAVGSGRPVRAATRWWAGALIVIGVVDVVVVVVVVSAPEALATPAPTTMRTALRMGSRRIEKNYLLTAEGSR
jgi:hypothetical protein